MADIKVIHTSDWHLGKRLYRKEREAEHILFLDWLVNLLKEEKADVLALAGDVFDSPTPPHNSLKIYYDFLKRVSDLGVYTVIISGNHDSQGLINAPKSLLKDKRVILRSKLQTDLDKNIVKIKIRGEELWIKCMPYFRNYELIKLAQDLKVFREDAPREEVFTEALDQFLAYWPKGSPAAKMLLSHHVFGNYSLTGSEHFIGLTGIESIPVGMLKARFDYAALGHIHKFQKISSEPESVYTGSPIQMRFSESKKKYVNKLIFNKDHPPLSTERIRIPVFRELIQVKTDSTRYIDDIKNALREIDCELTPFVEVQVEMLEAKTGLADVLKEICEENGASLLSFLPLIKNNAGEEEDKVDVSELDIMQLFRRFYKEKFPENEQAPPYLEAHFRTLLEETLDEDS